jgi:8-oxo-dGTP pyrophosphatase MutT (NUDIX family)
MTEPTLGKDTYFVAVKALLRRKEQLLITHDIFGQWDIPGGRLRPEDFDVPLEEVLERKLQQELGEEARYELGAPDVFFRHERPEHGLNGQRVRIFAVGYEAQYLGGSIVLGAHHDRYLWVHAATFPADQFFVDGWLAGIREYQRGLQSLADANPRHAVPPVT